MSQTRPFIINKNMGSNHLFYFFLDFIYLFLERGEGKEKERERNINVRLPLMYPPQGGPGRQPRHGP